MSGEQKFKKGFGSFLDPKEDVGSSIRHYFKSYLTSDKKPGFSGTVTLTDCHNQVSWEGYGSKGFAHLRKKIKKAISLLEKSLNDLDEVEQHFKNLK